MKRSPITRKTPLRHVSAKRRAAKASPEGKAGALRQNAKGKPCTLRLTGCRHDTSHTVLCHIRRNGWAGMGQKPNDLLAYFGCDRCHEKQERHHPDCADADLLRALGETLLIQLADGVVTIAEDI
jgi:hypothetical protein